jgi:HlyD family secretion protein
MTSDDLSRLTLEPHEKVANERRGRRLAAAVVVVVIFVIAAVVAGRGNRAVTPAATIGEAEEDAVAVRTAGLPSDRRGLVAGGYVEARRRARLYPGRDGMVERVIVGVGQRVYQGQVLLQLDTVIAAAEVAGARADVAGARAELEDARVAFRRLQELSQTSAVPEQQVDEARYRVSALAARVEGLDARARLAAARLDLSFLRAPFDGVIVRIDLEPGEVVSQFGGQAGSGGVEIADLSEIWVRVDVPETRIGGVRLGDPAEVIVDALGEDPLDAVVVEIAPVADRQSNTVEVAVRVLDPPRLLRPDLSARVTVYPRGANQRD